MTLPKLSAAASTPQSPGAATIAADTSVSTGGLAAAERGRLKGAMPGLVPSPFDDPTRWIVLGIESSLMDMKVEVIKASCYDLVRILLKADTLEPFPNGSWLARTRAENAHCVTPKKEDISRQYS